MKKLVILSVAASLSMAASQSDTLKSLEEQVKMLQAQIQELKADQEKLKNSTQVVNANGETLSVAKNAQDIKSIRTDLTDVKKQTSGDHIKFDADLRTAYDEINYKYNGNTGKKRRNGIWTNKLILGMSAAPTDNLVFRGSVGAYKIYGQNNIANSSYFQNFDWYDNQKPNDTALRIREAYFLYMNEMGNVPYTVSFGRRPSTDGFLTNLRADNATPNSPIGHNINMEFDGASFKFDLDKLTSIPGFYAKLCLGRGFSDTLGAYSMDTMGFKPGYINDNKNPNMDLAGLILQFYDDGQYKLLGNYFVAKNLMDMDIGRSSFSFKDVGDMTGGALSLQVNGIGDGISDFLDDSIFFASFAFSKTKPNGNELGVMTPNGIQQLPIGMLGSLDSKFGSSFYVGLQIPGFFQKDRIGFEYNHGSKYWRSFTYGEDTLIGSKLAARGDAYETYYILPIVDKNFTAQLSFLHIDYDYTGSDTFFGWTGTPMDVDQTPGAVKKAQQIRASLRYRY